MYRLIGGKSPILDITKAQADALEKALNGAAERGFVFRVSVGMRYWHPFIEDAVKQMHSEEIRSVLAVTLYPHYSLATTGSALDKFRDVVGGYPMEPADISAWYDHPLYIEALAGSIRKGLTLFGDGAEVLFSAHSLPMSIATSGDPYVTHIRTTIDEVVKKIDVRWHLSYQSKSGPVKWLEPSTEEKIKDLARSGVKNLLVVPISFVSDHIETLYEIDILYKRLAKEAGIKLIRAESLNTNVLFIRALKEMVMEKTRELGWTA